MFNQLIQLINSVSNKDFVSATSEIIKWIDNEKNIIALVGEIGIIPESIGHDTTEEKLFSKASDAVLARTFREIGLKSSVLSERTDSADVQAKSMIHEYTLVADAKAFRMSRTAKNQKDFINDRRDSIQKRGLFEIGYWDAEKEVIKGYSKEKAIEELIVAKKIDEKINQIRGYVGGLFA